MPCRYRSWHLGGPLALAASLYAGLADSAVAEPRVRAITLPGYTLTGTTILTSDSFLAFREPFVRAFGEDFPPEGACQAGGPYSHTDLVLVRHIDEAEPDVTLIPLPYRGNGILRLSPTRALVAATGPDGGLFTADDVVLLVDDLGGENRVVPIEVGWSGTQAAGERLADDAAILVHSGGAGAVLSDIGHANTVTPILDYLEEPIALDSTRFLVSTIFGTEGHFYDRSTGELERTTFELVGGYYANLTPLSASRVIDLPFPLEPGRLGLLDDLLSAPLQRELALPAPSWGKPTPLGPDRVLLRSQGPGEAPGLVDDQVFLVDQLDSPEPRVTTFSVPYCGAIGTLPVVLGPDLVAIVSGSTVSPHLQDSILVLSHLGTSNRAKSIFLGAIGQAVRLGARQLAVTAGPGLITISDMGGENRVTSTTIPFFNTKVFHPLERGTLLAGVSHEDQATVLLFRGLGERNPPRPIPLPFDPRAGLSLLGNGIALADADVYESESCTASRQVLSGLPGGIVLRARSLHVRFEAGAPARLRVSATLVLPRPDLFPGRELTVRVGTLTQALPATELIQTATGYRYRYRDPRGLRGWVRRLHYDTAANKLVIEGESPAAEAASIDPDNVVLSLESSSLYAAEGLAATMHGQHLRYSR